MSPESDSDGELSLFCVPSFPQTFGIHLQSAHVLSTVAQVDVSVQMLVALSKERNSQPVVEFWQLALHSHMSSTMNTSTIVPWHWPGREQSEQAEIGVRGRESRELSKCSTA